MPVATQHVPGTFCWPELATTDQDAAKAFYMALFDWTARDDAMGEAGIYTILSKDGHEVAALYTLMPDMRAQGVPAHWGAYISCADAQASADQATALGGKVVMGPIDVMQHGRMAVVQDPLGAMFCLWQPLSHAGIQLLGEPGSLGWTQLNAKDPERAKAFYTELLGWSFRDDPSPMGTYTTWLKSDGPAGGMMPMPAEAPAPSHWLGYWAVEDVAAAHAKALGLGGRSFVPPTDFGGGMMAVLADPQGAVFALVTFRPA